jgi:pilus assembly protein CpaF
METMAMMANLNLPEKAIRQQIASAVAIIIQISRMSDGTRRLTHFTEITGMSEDVVSLQDIFRFEKRGLSTNNKVLGRFRSTGLVPKFLEKLQASGIDIPMDIYNLSVDV